MSEPVKRTRPYRSRRRREQALATRARILDSATRLFAERGFGGTTVAAVAGDAGVAAETVYAVFRTKEALLGQAVRRAARGDDDAPILRQTGPRAVAAATAGREQLRLFAADIAARVERVGPLMAVLTDAASGNPELAELERELHDARRRNLRAFVDVLAARGPLRMKPADAADTVWALASPELYQLLTRVRGWSRARYVRWLEATLATLLLDQPP